MPAKGDVVTVSIDTTPEGITVAVDGEDRGVTPLDVRVAKGTAPLTISLKGAGYVPMSQQLVPDKDQRLVLSLLPAPKHRPHPPKGQGSGSGFHRFD